MRSIHELSAGVIPFRRPESSPLFPMYLVVHSARVRSPACAMGISEGGHRARGILAAGCSSRVRGGDRYQVVGFPRGV